MPQPTKTAKDVFLIALDAEPADRAAVLDVECAGDAGLRRQVEALLQVHDEPDSVLDRPRIDLGISGIAIPDPSPATGQPTVDQPITEKPGTQIGPYKLLQQIGEGGMGVVYMAEQKQPVKRRVALKIIKPGMDTRQVDRPLRGRTAGSGDDGASEHRSSARRRRDRNRPSLLRDGIGQRSSDHGVL